MSVQLIISGDHITDVIAQVENFASALGVGASREQSSPEPVCVEREIVQAPAIEEKVLDSTVATPEKKTLNRKEQDAAVDEMINNGAKDDRFELLTKGRQNEVEAALSKTEVAASDTTVDDMFNDEPSRFPKGVTRDDLSKLMGKVVKDKDGVLIQEKALKVRAILVEHLPEGVEVKVGNIDESKLDDVYAAIEALGS